MPVSTTTSALEGVYGRRQPGYAPHPALRAKLGCAQPGNRGGIGLFSDFNGNVDAPRPAWGTLELPLKQSEGADGIKGLPKWAHPAFLQEVPPRLEDCRQRLVAAERELKQLEVVAAVEAARQRWEVPGQNFNDGLHLPPLVSKKAVSMSPVGKYANQDLRSAGEPAPEPPMLEAPSEFFAHRRGDSSVSGTVGDEELSSQLEALEMQLVKLDAKWTSVDEQRLRSSRTTIKLQAEGLATKQELSEATSCLIDQKRLAEDLQRSFEVSESQATMLQTELQISKRLGDGLEKQAASLNVEIAAARGQIEDLSGQLRRLEVIKDQLNEQLVEAERTREDQRLVHEQQIRELHEVQAATNDEAARHLQEQRHLLEQHISESKEVQAAHADAAAQTLKEQRDVLEHRIAELRSVQALGAFESEQLMQRQLLELAELQAQLAARDRSAAQADEASQALKEQHHVLEQRIEELRSVEALGASESEQLMQRKLHELEELQDQQRIRDKAAATAVEDLQRRHTEQLRELEQVHQAKQEEVHQQHMQHIVKLEAAQAAREHEAGRSMQALMDELDEHKKLMDKVSQKASPEHDEVSQVVAAPAVPAVQAELRVVELEARYEEQQLYHERQLRELEVAQAAKYEALLKQLEEQRQLQAAQTAVAPVYDTKASLMSLASVASVAYTDVEDMLKTNGSLQLVFMTDLSAEASSYSSSVLKGLHPACCCVDPGNYELRLQRLRPEGVPEMVPLKNVVSFNLMSPGPDAPSDNWFGDLGGEMALDIEFHKQEQGSHMAAPSSRIRLLAPGHGAGALLAKLCAEDRIGPGALLGD